MLEAYLISVGTKSTILLAAGAILSWTLRRQSASARHRVCLAALSSAAAVPLAALWAPQWSVSITVPGGVGATAAQSGATAAISWAAILAGLWAFGALMMALRAAGGWLLLLRIRHSSVPFDKGDARVRLGRVSAPLACGVLQPWILLPVDAREWDDDRLRTVLLHERAHIRRRDCLAK